MIILLHGNAVLKCIDFSSFRRKDPVKQRPLTAHKFYLVPFYNLNNKNKVCVLKSLKS